jgi:hypothetical protein
VAKVPTTEEHDKLWARLTYKQRRAILRAVNRGEALESRKDARIAVGAARQQQRYWRWAWVFGPLAALLLFNRGMVQVVVNGALLGLVLGTLSFFRYRRAQKAEAANLERIGAGGGSPAKSRKAKKRKDDDGD